METSSSERGLRGLKFALGRTGQMLQNHAEFHTCSSLLCVNRNVYNKYVHHLYVTSVVWNSGQNDSEAPKQIELRGMGGAEHNYND